MKKIQSTCNYCAIDCNLDFYVENDRIVKVVPTKGYPVNDGCSCIKGLSLDKQQKTVKPNKLPKIRQADGSIAAYAADISVFKNEFIFAAGKHFCSDCENRLFQIIFGFIFLSLFIFSLFNFRKTLL